MTDPVETHTVVRVSMEGKPKRKREKAHRPPLGITRKAP
jgi:hypothetical protein